MAAINGFDKAFKVDGIKKKASYLAKCKIGNYAKTFAHKKKTVPLELRRIGGDGSSVWNFCTPFSDVILLGNCWWCGKTLAVFSG